jgi:hypothetical protein
MNMAATNTSNMINIKMTASAGQNMNNNGTFYMADRLKKNNGGNFNRPISIDDGSSNMII